MKLPILPADVNDFLRIDSYSPGQIFYHLHSFPPFERNSEVQKLASSKFLDKVIPYYEQRGLKASTVVYNFLVEPLKNANFHGPRDENIRFEIFLTPLVLVASYFDGGSYFARSEVKEAWESRVRYPEKHDAGVYGIGHDVGTDLIYHLADLIHVDTSSGTLYTGMMVKEFCC